MSPSSVEDLLAGAITGLREAELTGVLIGSERLIFDANERARELLDLDVIPPDGVDWLAMTPPEYRGGDDRAIDDAIKYSVSRWFRKEFVLRGGRRRSIDLIVVATGVDPFRWVAFLRETGSSPLPVAGSPSPSRPDPDGEATIRLARRLAGAATTNDVLASVDRLAAAAVPCEYVNIATVTDDATLRIHHDPGTAVDVQRRYDEIDLDTTTLLGEAVLHDRCEIMSIDTFERRYPGLGSDGRAMGFTHLASAPLHTESGRIIGSMGLAWKAAQVDVPNDRVQTIADLVGHALDLANDTERSRSMATSFQQMLLPARLDDVEGATVRVRYQAVDRAVGGDFYDIVTVEDGSTWLVIGDVAGHGIPASRTMGKVRFFLRAVLRDRRRPAEVLAQVHRLLVAEGFHELATCLVARWDPATGRVTIATAGHLPPLLVPGAALNVRVNPPLGTPAATFHDDDLEVPVAPWTRMLMYTDGLIERRDEPIDDSIASLANRLEGVGPLPVALAAETLMTECRSAGEDDMALMLVEFTPTKRGDAVSE